MKAANPRRIAIMLPRFSRYGGVEQFGYQLTKALVENGYAVDFICARKEVETLEGARVIVVGRVGGLRICKMLWFLFFAERARRKGEYDLSISLGKTWNQDITRVGGGPLSVFWRLSSKAWPKGWPRVRKKLLRMLAPANWLTFLIERRMYRKTPHIVTISDKVRSWLEEAYPHLALPPEKTGQTVHTIYNCPDLSRYSPPSTEERAQARRAFQTPPDAYAVGVATTNFLLKGVGQLIEALAFLPEDTHLFVAGGRAAAQYERLAKNLGLGNRVHFCGKVAAMPQFYHSLDMFVLPTFYDTLGNVVLEAMASGLKTLCSSRAGAASFLPANQIIVDPSNPHEIAEKILALRAAGAGASFVPKGGGMDEFIQLVEALIAEKRMKV